MTIALFANFEGIEKLFFAPDQSLNSKIMNQCNIDFSGIKKGAKISFHRHFNTEPVELDEFLNGKVCKFGT